MIKKTPSPLLKLPPLLRFSSGAHILWLDKVPAFTRYREHHVSCMFQNSPAHTWRVLFKGHGPVHYPHLLLILFCSLWGEEQPQPHTFHVLRQAWRLQLQLHGACFLHPLSQLTLCTRTQQGHSLTLNHHTNKISYSVCRPCRESINYQTRSDEDTVSGIIGPLHGLNMYTAV